MRLHVPAISQDRLQNKAKPRLAFASKTLMRLSYRPQLLNPFTPRSDHALGGPTAGHKLRRRCCAQHPLAQHLKHEMANLATLLILLHALIYKSRGLQQPSIILDEQLVSSFGSISSEAGPVHTKWLQNYLVRGLHDSNKTWSLNTGPRYEDWDFMVQSFSLLAASWVGLRSRLPAPWCRAMWRCTHSSSKDNTQW